MSKFREKAAEVKAAGVAERGNFTPTGVPKRMYQWWLDNSISDKAEAIKSGARKENFCHFWRVVVIWVPLLKLMVAGEKFVSSTTGKIFGVLATAMILAWVLYIAVSDWWNFLTVVGWSALVIAGAALVVGLLFWLDNLHKKIVPTLFGLFGVAILGYFLVLAFFEVGFWLFAIIAGVIGGIVGIVAFGIAAENWISGRRVLRKQREADAEEARRKRMHELFELYLKGEGPNPYDRPVKAPREPSKIDKFFSGVGDFLILIGQVVRVNKWKICPLVEVEPVAKPVPANAYDADDDDWY